MAFHVAYSFLRPITSSGHNLSCLQWCLLPSPHNLSCDSITLILPLATFHQIFRWASWVNGAGWENWHRTRRSWWRANVCATERRAHLPQHLLALTNSHIFVIQTQIEEQRDKPPLVHIIPTRYPHPHLCNSYSPPNYSQSLLDFVAKSQLLLFCNLCDKYLALNLVLVE